MSAIEALCMPKWGLTMEEGAVVHWWKNEGDTLAEGDDLADIETSKITNALEAPGVGILRRQVAQIGDVLPVGSLICVMAEPQVSDEEIDAFIADFQSRFVPETQAAEDGGGLKSSPVTAAGRTVQVGRLGEGEATPFVLLHGYAGDMNGWAFNIEALSQAAPVIALDLPGHGQSEKEVGDASLASFAEIVSACLAELGVTRANLVGHSFGAAVAARIAADEPALVESLTLICPPGLPGSTLNAAFLRGVADAQRPRDLRPWLELLTASPDIVGNEMVEDVMRFKRLDGSDEALSALALRLIEGADLDALRPDLDRIPSALVIASSHDQIVGRPDPAGLPEGFEVVVLDDVGHMPHVAKADAVNALILSRARPA